MRLDIGEILEHTAKKHGKKTGIWFEGKEVTYQKFYSNANRYANAFKRSGIKKGDVISIMLPNIPEFLYAYFGAQRIGAVVVTINPMFKGGEVKYILNDSGAKILVTLASFISLINELRPEVPNLEQVVITGERDVTLLQPDSTMVVQMVFDEKEFLLDDAYQRVGNALVRVFNELGVSDAWYKHRGGVRVGGKKIAGFGFGSTDGGDVILMNALCFLSKLNIDDFFKVVWVPNEVKDKFTEPLTSIEEITGDKPTKEHFKDVVVKVFSDELKLNLDEDAKLGRDELFGLEKQRSLAYRNI